MSLGMQKLLASALAAALSIAGAACTPGCPDPVLANPVSATWSPARTISSDAGVASPGSVVVVRWSPTRGDSLPDSYYAAVQFNAGTDAGSVVQSVTLTATRELTIEIGDLDAYLKSSSRLELNLGLPDTRGAVKCSHPGMSDSFNVPLTLEFNPTTRTATARFGEVSAYRGACSVGGQPGKADAGVAFALLLMATGAAARRRARGHEPTR